MRWWVDIANAPNVNVFRPIVERLRAEGHDVVITAWDRGQAGALSAEAWPEARFFGHNGYRTGWGSKGTDIAARAALLARAMRHERLDVALGHASNAQVMAARALRVRSVEMMDYEHHPANHVGFRLADLVMLPEVIPYSAVRKFGLSRRRFVPYPGIKEEIALAAFQPAQGFRSMLGLGEDELLGVVRPAAEGAMYHRHPNSLFDDVVDRLVEFGATVLLAPRTTTQGELYDGRKGVHVLFEPVSGPDLLHSADVFVGAGGSMTREAAVLGTMAYSIFQGKPAAVDLRLEEHGRLITLRRTLDLPPPTRDPGGAERTATPEVLDRFMSLLMRCVSQLVSVSA
jgi:predicted glycosyltransferase